MQYPSATLSRPPPPPHPLPPRPLPQAASSPDENGGQPFALLIIPLMSFRWIYEEKSGKAFKDLPSSFKCPVRVYPVPAYVLVSLPSWLAMVPLLQVCAAPKRRFGAYSGPKGNNTKAAMDERYAKLQTGGSRCAPCTRSSAYLFHVRQQPRRKPHPPSIPAWRETLTLLLMQGQWFNRCGPHCSRASGAGWFIRIPSNPVLGAALPITLAPAFGEDTESV